MNNARVIGLCGHSGSGKSVVADYLVSQYGFVRIKLASPLKNMLRAIGLSEREIEGDLKEVPSDKLGGKTPRHAMQTLGTEWGRDLIGPAFWVDAWVRDARAALSEGKSVCCDDVRFLNEVGAIWLLGGSVIRIERVGVSTGDHASEAQNFAVDWTIPNIGTIGELRRRVDEVLALASERAA